MLLHYYFQRTKKEKWQMSNAWQKVCDKHWVDALFDHDGDTTNSGLYRYGVRLRRWMDHNKNPASVDYQFVKLRLLMLERMFRDGSGSGFWTP
jgi:hypothetical protein